MKTIKRYSFQSEIRHNNKTYYVNAISSAKEQADKENDTLKVLLYNRRLEGKTDLHGNKYEPSIWYYSLNKNI